MYNFYKLLKSKVWIKKDNVGIDYSDGDDTENYLYDVVRKAKDKSVFSKDLIAAIKDWPSYYYFSPI